MPEPMIKPEGMAQNDGERHAAQRCLATLRQDPPHLTLILTAESLSAQAPHLETLQAHHLHDILGVQEGDQAYLVDQVQAAEPAGCVPFEERHDRAAGLVHRFRCVHDVPRTASHADVRVTFSA